MSNSPSGIGSVLRKIGLYASLLLVVTLVVLYFVFSFKYSEGNRAGVVIKFSKKGFVFKTYEGELNMGGLGNVPNVAQGNQIWEFSVKDSKVADELMQLEGRKVSLHYAEVVKNFPWQGDTKYFVDGVELINE